MKCVEEFMWASFKYIRWIREWAGASENQRFFSFPEKEKYFTAQPDESFFLLNRKGSLSVDEWSMAQSYTKSRIMQDKEKYKAIPLLAVISIFGNKSNPALEVERVVKDERFFTAPTLMYLAM